MLAAEGYTVSDGARGTMVNPALPRDKKPVTFAAPKKPRQAQLRQLPRKPFLFRMGLPAIDLFPRKQWAQIAARVTRQLDVEQFAHPRDVLGFAPLRRAIAGYSRIARGISCGAGQVLITAGSLGALELIAATLLKPSDTIWVEDPGYFFARDLLRSAAATRRCPGRQRGARRRSRHRGRAERRAGAGDADASVSARHDNVDGAPAGFARMGQRAAGLDRGGRLRLRIPSPRRAAAGADQP
jgi:hypothetical protein